MTDYQIRYASENDIHAIAELLHEAFLQFRSLYTLEAFQKTAPGAQQILHRMSEGPIWVAILDQRIIATVSAKSQQRSIYVRGMAVHPSFRAKGLARALLNHVETFAASQEYKSMVLSTTPFLTAAISLYESFGFVRSDEGPHQLHGTPLFTMVKRVVSFSRHSIGAR